MRRLNWPALASFKPSRWGTTRGHGRVLRILGTLLERRGRRRTAGSGRCAGAAVRRRSNSPRRWPRWASGCRRNRSGSPPDEAVETLRRAYLLAAGCGAAGLQARAGQSLIRLGQQVPAPPRRTGLTTTEREIARMSVDGAFDQEIAQALFITTSTVRQTLDGVRQRLGVTSPEELRALVAAR